MSRHRKAGLDIAAFCAQGIAMRTYFMKFDFDAWAQLAKDDPAEFERRRQAAVREAIDNAPPAFRQRLQRLQNRLDRERNPAMDPRNTRVMNTLLWAGFYRLRKELAAPPAVRRPIGPLHSAQIIPFRSRLSAGATIRESGGADV
jgi:hypothetical protein